MRFRRGYLEGHPKTGTVPYVDEAFFDDWIGQTFDDVVPPLGLAVRVFERDVVLRQGRGHMNVSGETDQAVENAVRGNQNAVNIGVFGDPLELGDAAYVFRVGTDY